MLDVVIKCKPQQLESGASAEITATVRSTNDKDVTVTLHFLAPEASLTPHVITVTLTKGGSGLKRGSGSITSKVTATSNAWYKLTGQASDGESQAHAETLVSVK